MTTNKRIIKSIIILSVLFFSFKQNFPNRTVLFESFQDCGEKNITQRLLGEWSWIKGESFGFTGLVLTNPHQCNCTKKLIFSDNCMWQENINETMHSPSSIMIKF